MIHKPFIEKNCCIEFEGKSFCAGGSIVTDKFVIGYPDENGILRTWKGEDIGTWRSVASWPVFSYYGSTMHQIEATIEGIIYTGRGFGIGSIYKGKRKVSQ